MTESVLALHDVSVRVAATGVALVEGIDLTIAPGEIVCVVGESGSGKSVTGRTVMGLSQRDRRLDVTGRIRFGGVESVDGDIGVLAGVRGRDLAMVFQEPLSSLDPLFTVEAQLRESLRRARGRMPRPQEREIFRTLLRDVGITDPDRVLRAHPHELSGGMCQRVMIASALACEPRLLVADEPTSALDVTVQAQIVDVLLRLREEHGMAVLLVTHDMGLAAEIADRIVVMYSGRIVEVGDPDSLFHDARHPYTRGLLACVPSLTRSSDGPLPTIPGSVPSPASRPAGCPFAPRCDAATDQCREAMPDVVVEGARHFACWNPRGAGASTRRELVLG
jgi:peptide/nickel transport system ATP-binding protein